MSEPEDDRDEKWLQEFMGGQDEVSRAYRQASKETPPPEVDDAVIRLAQQEDALRKRMGKDARGTGAIARVFLARRLQWPFALAATVVIAFSAIMALREDHGARNAALLPAPARAPESAAPAAKQEAAPAADTNAAVVAKPSEADLARSRSRMDYETAPASSGNLAAQAPAPAAAPAPAKMNEEPQAQARDEVGTTAGAAAPVEELKRAPAQADAAPPPPAFAERREVLPAPQRSSVAAAWESNAPLAKSTYSETQACPNDVPNCGAWRSAQRQLDTIYARDEARRAHCYTDQCPIGSTVTAQELPQVAPAFAGEASSSRLRGRWQTDLVAYAFSDRYVLERRIEDDGSITVLLRKVRYHPIGEGIEVLQDASAGEDPVVVLRVAVESSRSLRMLDSHGEPHGALAPGTLPVERWLQK